MTRVQVSWEDRSGTQRNARATIEDKSKSGMRVRIMIPIEVGTKLTIKSQSEEFSGVVNNSIKDDLGYSLGVLREESSDVTVESELQRQSK